MRQEERAVVMPVVAGEPIRHRGLRRGRLQCRVGIDHPGRRVEARIGDPPHADPAVVVGHVLDQPIDRVVGVRALVDVGGLLLAVAMRPHVLELALRHPSAADVLVGDDIAVAAEGRRWADVRLVGVLAIRLDPVRRAQQHHRIPMPLLLGDVDRREQPDPVAHRDAVFILGVMSLDIIDPLRGDGTRQGIARAISRRARRNRAAHPTAHHLRDSHSLFVFHHGADRARSTIPREIRDEGNRIIGRGIPSQRPSPSRSR